MNETIIRTMPAVALRGIVAFPRMRLNFEVGRQKSMDALKAALSENRPVFLAAQKDLLVEEPEKNDLFDMGVIATVKQIMKNPDDDNYRVFVECNRRALLDDIIQTKPYLIANVQMREDKKVSVARHDREVATIRCAKDIFAEYSAACLHLSPDMIFSIVSEERSGRLADYISANIALEYRDKQKILEELDPIKRLEKLCSILEKENKLLKIEADINDRVNEQIDKNQKNYYLREQMKAISIELNDGIEPEDEVDELREKITALTMDEDSKNKLLKECDRLERMSPQSAESAVSRTYIETCLELPWNTYTKDKLNLKRARKILDDDHFGLSDVKDRIIESLAVRKLTDDNKGQIICLVGPPGVGKTSVAKSVARAMGRNYVRISLGGVRDEAEIRGHRKTYIGSMPGRIINAMQQAKSKNPLMLLDEIDKLGSDYKGDPSSALLEVLDSEQNVSFRDHYIELPFDLSNVFFITTANDKSTIPAPLLDRMDVIELSSYTHEEKFNIAKKHLVPKQIKKHGMNLRSLRFTDSAIREIIDGYTREAGVRKLERRIADICRKAAVETVNGEQEKIKVNDFDIENYLGSRKFKDSNDSLSDEIGVVNGLAWTSVGGEMLKTEVAVLDGSGKLELTGSLGDVMKESAKAAVSFIRSCTEKYGIEKEFYKTKDIHIHFPEGAVPKDGPSAGVTIVTALVSALSGREVKGNVAMTGEITLRGRVLPIGGLKEKTMAAYRAGMSTVIIPFDNVSDLDKVDPAVKDAINFIPVKYADEVLNAALCKKDEIDFKEKISIPMTDSVALKGTVITQ